MLTNEEIQEAIFFAKETNGCRMRCVLEEYPCRLLDNSEKELKCKIVEAFPNERYSSNDVREDNRFWRRILKENLRWLPK